MSEYTDPSDVDGENITPESVSTDQGTITSLDGTDMQYESGDINDLFTKGRNGTHFVYKDGAGNVVGINDSGIVSEGADATTVIQAVLDDATAGSKIVLSDDTFSVSGLTPGQTDIIFEGTSTGDDATTLLTDGDAFSVGSGAGLFNGWEIRNVNFHGTQTGTRGVGQVSEDFNATYKGYDSYGILHTTFSHCSFDDSLEEGVDANAVSSEFLHCQYGASPAGRMLYGLRLRGTDSKRANANLIFGGRSAPLTATGSILFQFYNSSSGIWVENVVTDGSDSYFIDAHDAYTWIKNVHVEAVNNGGAIINSDYDALTSAGYPLIMGGFFSSNNNTALVGGNRAGRTNIVFPLLSGTFSNSNKYTTGGYPRMLISKDALVINGIPRSRILGTPPSFFETGDWYIDDGTNTASGNVAMRIYDGTAWVDQN